MHRVQMYDRDIRQMELTFWDTYSCQTTHSFFVHTCFSDRPVFLLPGWSLLFSDSRRLSWAPAVDKMLLLLVAAVLQLPSSPEPVVCKQIKAQNTSRSTMFIPPGVPVAHKSKETSTLKTNAHLIVGNTVLFQISVEIPAMRYQCQAKQGFPITYICF